MPILILQEPRLIYAASDIFRLFFGSVRLHHLGISAGLEEPIWQVDLPPVAQFGAPWQPTFFAGAQGQYRTGFDAACQALLDENTDWLKQIRRQFKIHLYDWCVQQTGKSFPWGSLTGIRPTLIAEELWPSDVAKQMDAYWLGETAKRMHNTYRVSLDKADLAVRTMLEEQWLMASFPVENIGLYIGIPFCPTRCRYCSFTMKEGIGLTTADMQPYVDALCLEIDQTLSTLRPKISTIYIGGGTPTSLSVKQLEQVYQTLSQYVSMADIECCLEAGRPDTIDQPKLVSAKSWGISRLCINPQTMHDHTLALIHRQHTTAQTLEAFRLARHVGFDDINMDLIAGLWGEGVPEMAKTLTAIEALEPDSLTVHALAIKRASDWHEERVSHDADLGALKKPNQVVWQMMHMAEAWCQSKGLFPYYLYRQKDGLGGLENVGYARPGKGNLYNVAMMGDQRSILAFGAGAMSKRCYPDGRIERRANVKGLPDYLARVEEMVERKRQLFQP